MVGFCRAVKVADAFKIKNNQKIKAWFETQTPQTQVWFVARAGLRLFPMAGSTRGEDQLRHELSAGRLPNDKSGNWYVLATIRSLLVSVAASNFEQTQSYDLSGAILRARPDKATTFVVDYWPDSIRKSAWLSASSCIRAAGAFTDPDPDKKGLRFDAFRYLDENFEAAALQDMNLGKQWNALWLGASPPQPAVDSWNDVKSWFANDDADWSLWIEWYEGILEGTPMDWDLIFKIATEISDEDWNAGQSRVADRIEEIRRDFYGNPLDQDALRSHLQKVVGSPVVFADSAESVASLTLDAIDRFKSMEPQCNRLPEGYATFEELPRQFSAISIVLRSSDSGDAKATKLQGEVNRLNALFQQLRLDLAEARNALADARLTAIEAKHIRTFGQRLQTTLANVTLVGALGMATLGFFGVTAEDLKYDALKGALQDLAKDMENVRPSPVIDHLPPATKV